MILILVTASVSLILSEQATCTNCINFESSVLQSWGWMQTDNEGVVWEERKKEEEK